MANNWGITGTRTLRANIEALTSASAEFDNMIDAEMSKIAPAVKDSLDYHSDLQKNRITGDMVDALGAEWKGKQLRFGFIRGLGALYQKLQTISGFTHLGGEFIRPSLAIKDAAEDATLLMREAQRRIRRNFMQRLRRRG